MPHRSFEPLDDVGERRQHFEQAEEHHAVVNGEREAAIEAAAQILDRLADTGDDERNADEQVRQGMPDESYEARPLGETGLHHATRAVSIDVPGPIAITTRRSP